MAGNKSLKSLALSFLVVIVIVAAINCGNGNPSAKAQPITQTYPPQATATKAPAASGDYWTAEASLLIAKSGLGAATVDGKIYAIGGRNGDSIFATNQQYDPATNTWTYKAPMPTPRYNFAVAVYSGKIYCIGGIATLNFYQEGVGFTLSNVAEIYDPATDNWTIGAPMPQASDGEASVVNGEIYVMSGRSNPNLNLNQAYDPNTDQWSTKTPMPDRNGWCAASAAVGNKIYVLGGISIAVGPTIMQIYDVTTDSWTTGSSPSGAMGGDADGAVTIGSPNNPRIELFGLTEYADTISNGSTANQIYDPSTDSWKVVASMPTSREKFGIALLNNEIYVIGGSIPYYPYAPDDVGGYTLYFSTNERYTIPAVLVMPTPTVTPVPATNTTKATLPPTPSPKPIITAEDVAIVATAVLIAVAVSVILLKSRPKKSNQGKNSIEN